ncbi:MAG: dienelactone hydrolase family protein [Acidimicrobiales bacterium]
MTSTRNETLAGGDGGTAIVVAPEDASGHGIVLFQEIFGVNDFLLAKAGDLARLGYTVLCPDVFWRIRPSAEVNLRHRPPTPCREASSAMCPTRVPARRLAPPRRGGPKHRDDRRRRPRPDLSDDREPEAFVQRHVPGVGGLEVGDHTLVGV